jgi:hypothetical protein
VWIFSLFAQNCASRSRKRKTETERETEESAICDRKRRRNEFRNGNIGCSIFRNCTGDIGEDVSAGDERDRRNRYGGRGSDTRQKLLQRQLEFVDIREEYIKDEQKNLKREFLRAQEEVKRIQSVPLVIGQFIEMVDQNNGIVGSTTGYNYYVRILSTINRELLKPSSSVALHRHSNALVDILPPEADSSISLLSQSEKPDVTYSVCLSLSQSYTFVQLESHELLSK